MRKTFSKYCNQNVKVWLGLVYVAIRKQNRECAPHLTTNAQNLARAIHYPANWDKADGVLVTNERKTHDKKLSTW